MEYVNNFELVDKLITDITLFYEDDDLESEYVFIPTESFINEIVTTKQRPKISFKFCGEKFVERLYLKSNPYDRKTFDNKMVDFLPGVPYSEFYNVQIKNFKLTDDLKPFYKHNKKGLYYDMRYVLNMRLNKHKDIVVKAITTMNYCFCPSM